MNKENEKFNIKKRFTSMIKVDFRRMFTTPFYYIMIGICLIVPILIIVMTSMMEGSVMTDQNGNIILDEFGNPLLMEGFKNVWQMLGSTTSSSNAMSMDLVSMCNINMMFFLVAVLVCVFISDDFRSGYSKCLFTIRSDKKDYVTSKTLVGFIGGATMILAFFIGLLIGGAIGNLSFELIDVNISNIIMCLFSKIFLVLIFVSIFVTMSCVGKQKTWLSLIGSLAVSMLFFMMISTISPLDSTIINVILSLAGGILFSIIFGIISNVILRKTSLV